ncbi:unnamed protein product [marine sediment metagenome]|uniref:Uncharacterized protein n=1 Tax=marine sediment metagenome TaxID=412755 RepID=X1AHG0_9ZZZZ
MLLNSVAAGARQGTGFGVGYQMVTGGVPGGVPEGFNDVTDTTELSNTDSEL